MRNKPSPRPRVTPPSPEDRQAHPRNTPHTGRRAAIIVLAIAAAVAAIRATTHDTPPPNIAKPAPAAPEKHPEVVRESLEQRTDRVIERTDKGFQEFAKKVLPLIEALEDESLKVELRKPFAIFKQNEGNPAGKNYYRFMAQMKAEGQRSQDIKSPYYYYALADEHIDPTSHLGAAFEPYRRTMLIYEETNPNNMVDMAILAHEILHVGQDDEDRATIRSPEDIQAYMAKYHRKPTHGSGVFDISTEVPAAQQDIELTNLLLGGKLKQIAVSGKVINSTNFINKLTPLAGETTVYLDEAIPLLSKAYEAKGVDLMSLARELGIPANQPKAVYHLVCVIELADKYYNDPSPQHAKLKEFLVENYGRSGDVYDVVNGKEVKLK